MDEKYTYELIKHLRKAQEKFYDKHNLEGSFWCVDLTIYEMDLMFEQPLKKVIDQDHGYPQFKGR